jgi:hypothetical protein
VETGKLEVKGRKEKKLEILCNPPMRHGNKCKIILEKRRKIRSRKRGK